MIKKVLILRFSSIGDIVLTTPIVRCVKKQLNCELHFLTKRRFQSILEENPNIDRLITFNDSIKEVADELKKEKYDFVVDLHNNFRTRVLRSKLGVKSKAFPKLNIEKWLYVNFKFDTMPELHVVDRYFKAVDALGVKNDNLGIDYYCSETDKLDLNSFSDLDLSAGFVVYTLGAQFKTKCLPIEKITELLPKINLPVILLGGPEDQEIGDKLNAKFPTNTLNLAGKLNLNQSAYVLSQSKVVIAHDTGLMHIASAFNKPIAVIWGNTTPQIGMWPYGVKSAVAFFEVENLKCRPCSKIGFQQCPKKHFKCMMNQDLDAISSFVNQF